MLFDRKTFFDAVRTPVFGGHITSSQVSGLESLLAEWEKKPPADDLRFLAYCLGTAFWETGKTLQPIEEYGKGKGHSYGNPTGPWNQVYDGRGDVQLTFLANYTKATARLHALGLLDADLNLAETPSLAMRPDLAAAILYLGCIEGWFTGKKLADYFTSAISDWVNARRIVNGTDHASTIAGYAMNFLPALTQAAAAGAVAAAVEPTPPIAPTASGPSPAPASVPPATNESAPMTNATTATTQNVDVLAGLQNVFGNLVSSIESSVKTTASSATSSIVSNTIGGTIAADIADAEAAASDIKQAIADSKAGKWSNEPHDIIDFVKHVFAILTRSGISVPVVSSIVAALPDLPPVAQAA